MKNIFDRIAAFARGRDLTAKGICLILAVILWALISSSKTETRKFKIPIVQKNMPNHLTVAQIANKYVLVTVEGKKDLLNSVNMKNIKATVNLKNPAIGESRLYPIQLERHNVPESVNLTLSMKEVSLTVERIEEKWIKVNTPHIAGNVKDGTVIGSITIIPDRVKISGPRSVVKDIEFVYTDPISVQNESGDVVRVVGLQRDNFEGVEFYDTTVKVVISILEYENLFNVDARVDIRNPQEGFKYSLDIDEIKVYMKTSDKEKISSSDVSAYLDVGKINAALLFDKVEKNEIYKEMPVNIEIGNKKLDIVSVMPDRVMLKIEKKR